MKVFKNYDYSMELSVLLKNINIFRVVLILLFIGNGYSSITAQYKALDFELNVSDYKDDYNDTEYSYSSISGSALAQASIGYSFSIGKKIVLSPRIAYAYALDGYRLNQLMETGGSLEDRTYIVKSKKITFFKTGVAMSYWISNLGKGLFVESEVQSVFLIGAKSREKKRVGSGEIEEYTVSFKDEIKEYVPSLRIGVGYRVPIKSLSFFIRVSREFRVSTYYKSTDNYTLMNNSVGLGFSYRFKQSLHENEPTD